MGLRRRHVSHFGVFATLSWANHACHHNAQQSWNTSTQQLDVYALADIKAGEQITLNYNPENIISRLYTYRAYGFMCFCAWCEADVDEGQRRESNERRREINRGLLGVSREVAPGRAMRGASEVVAGLILEHVKDYRLGLVFADAFDIALSVGEGYVAIL